MREEVAMQNNNIIDKIITHMINNPYLYICLLISGGIYFWWRSNKEINPVVAFTVSVVVGVIAYIVLTTFMPSMFIL